MILFEVVGEYSMLRSFRWEAAPEVEASIPKGKLTDFVGVCGEGLVVPRWMFGCFCVKFSILESSSRLVVERACRSLDRD